MQNSVKQVVTSRDMKSSIVQSLAYSAVFDYPLNKKEIIAGMDMVIGHDAEIEADLEFLVKDGTVLKHGAFYGLKSGNNSFKKRVERNKRAYKYLSWAYIISRVIGNFPFVRAVFISGSLSKNSMDADSDIDYFIITKTGRLWLARTLLVVFKKIFLFNSYKLFCVNYFLDEENLEIKDHDLYTAHEVATLIPTYGKKTCTSFLAINSWIFNYLPNTKPKHLERTRDTKIRGLKYLLEKLFTGKFGDSFEQKCRKISEKYWEKKHGHLNPEEKKLTLVLEENKSTYHPDNFRFKVLKRHKELMMNCIPRKVQYP